MYEIINLLQETEDYYFVDYIPYRVDAANFLELEEYFEENYLPLFAEKVARIILKMIYYYPCEVYLTKPTKKAPEKMDLIFDANIRNYSPEKLAEIIRQVILTDFSTLQILFTTPQFLVSVCGEFSVTIYGASGKKEAVNLLQQLILQEGLFLK